jgi:Holliday junction DNA helicase RuvB
MAKHTEVNEVKPATLDGLVGQAGVVEQVRVALAAAQADRRPFDHALLVGPAGCGKTTIAHVVSREMSSKMHEVLGQALETAADLNFLLLGAKDRDVVFIDEAALIPSEQQHALLLALDQRKIVLGGGRGGRSPQSIPLARFSLLLATTHEHSIIAPLVDRLKLLLRFGFYTEPELVKVLRQRCLALEWPIEKDVLPQIAQRSRGVPRLALRLAQAAWRVARSEGEARITIDFLRRACLLEGIDRLGLGPVEQQYLRVVGEGTNRLNMIASRLGLPARTISEVVESFLIRAGLVDKDEGSRRVLTQRGREHLLALDRQEGV